MRGIIALAIIVAVFWYGCGGPSSPPRPRIGPDNPTPPPPTAAHFMQPKPVSPDVDRATGPTPTEEHAKAERKREKQRLMDEFEAGDFSQQCVRRHLKYPDDASFGFWDIPDVKANAAGTVFSVKSKVKAKNGFGAELTYQWATIVTSRSGAWELVTLAIGNETVYENSSLLAQLKDDAKPKPPPPDPAEEAHKEAVRAAARAAEERAEREAAIVARKELKADLRKRLSAVDAESRRKACAELGKLGSDAVDALPALRSVADADPNLYVRQAAESAIKKIGQ